MENAVFVCATDTDAGKTFVSACLLNRLISKNINAGYIKPVETGLGDDLVPIDPNFIISLNPGFKFNADDCIVEKCKYPLSPLDSLRLEKRTIDKNLLLDKTKTICNKFDFSIIEGAGGVFVPILENYWMIDFINELDVSVVVVAKSGLGTINHSVLTIEALKKEKIKVNCFIFNGKKSDNSKNNIKNIENYTGTKCAGEIPFIEDIKKPFFGSLKLDYKLIFGF
jgi:dethiobiotin synthetase